MNKLAAGVLIIVTGVAAGCQRPSKGLDYTVYLDHMPASILVLPPVNQSGDKEATKDFMESVSRPLAERGYYVFPVAVVESVMVANGATTPLEMRKVPLAKLEELLVPMRFCTSTSWSGRNAMSSWTPQRRWA